MHQEDCGLGLKDIIGISETVLLTWHDFPNATPMKAYKYDSNSFHSLEIESFHTIIVDFFCFCNFSISQERSA